MKILSANQIRQADQYTIRHEPVKSIDLMERAAGLCAEWIMQHIRPSCNTLKIFCGPGNNGGDGLAIARLTAKAFSKVEVYMLKAERYSRDFLINEKRLLKEKKVKVYRISGIKDLPGLSEKECIVDALFGSGLNKPISGIAAEIIARINKSKALKVAIDMPSGLFADQASQGPAILQADYTLTFQCPKLSFLFAENFKYAGDFITLDLNLDKKFIAEIPAKNTYLTVPLIQELIKKRNKFDHKGTYGHALIVAGSYGKMGAAVLASRACFRSGAGLVTVHIPGCGHAIMQTALPEAMVETDKDKRYISNASIGRYNSVGIGPGISTKDKPAKALRELIQSGTKPVVIDADALNILSQHKSWMKYIPGESILTPHPKEFERLAGKTTNDFDRYQLQLDFASKHNVYIILKGAHTCIACPDGSAYFNSTGNPGMATAGSGDVLTGVLTGLLAQGYSSLSSCLLGVYLHGLAGDIAAKARSLQGLMAGDIIEAIPAAYKMLR